MKDVDETYQRACKLAEQGRVDEARQVYESLKASVRNSRIRALVENDLGALDVACGNTESARRRFEKALDIDGNCGPARSNLALVSDTPESAVRTRDVQDVSTGKVKVAILSFLFNWPSRGGGIIHTVELARFLQRAGFEVRLYHPRFSQWGIGRVDAGCPFPAEGLDFEESTWNVGEIKSRFRRAVDTFGPDYVIITDCWNFKPHLADAMRSYRYVLRMQALECLCPLNNLRLLSGAESGFQQCSKNQLATPEDCRECLRRRGSTSGSLHQAERALSGVGTREYTELLHRSLQEAEAVLTLNPVVAELFRPFSRRVEVVTWGMDTERFGTPFENVVEKERRCGDGRATLVFAGVVEEGIKGFDVLLDACTELWSKRQDFELVVTGEPEGRINEFTRFIGWQSQESLPDIYRAADICIVPTIAQDGLSRTSVEAMASGLPVIASRIGGLPYTVRDGETGLLYEPGNAEDLVKKIERLLDEPQLRDKMGRAGRRRFEERFTWEQVIERDYRRLLPKPPVSESVDALTEAMGQNAAAVHVQTSSRGALPGHRGDDRVKVNLGCGLDFREGWLNVDVRPLYPGNAGFLCCDLADVDEHIEDESVEEIVAQDVLEFVPWRQLDGVLVTLWKKLRLGGVLFIRVPDLKAAVSAYSAGEISHEEMQRVACGCQGYAEETVRSAWSAEEVVSRLQMAGLNVERLEGRDHRVLVWGRRAV